MLNIYKYYDDPQSLSMSEMRSAIALLQSPQKWDADTKTSLDPIIHIVAKDPKTALMYITMYAFHPWPEAEPAISTDEHSSYQYALRILKGRFEKGEHSISLEPYYAILYAKDILAKDSSWQYKNGRWPEAEKAIIKSMEEYAIDAENYAYEYAASVLGERWPEAEPYIRNNDYVWGKYKEKFGIE
jgi:hypothetical protein